MILLDTNVISELMRSTPDAKVLRWVNAQVAAALHTTSITEAEIVHGVLLLPKGKRRTTLVALAREMFEVDLDGRILAFDSAAANLYAEISSTRRATGRPISAFDAQIAAIAAVHGARLATRNGSDFADCGIDVIDPWTA
jgi:predicted nucleic acid-binding protein